MDNCKRDPPDSKSEVFSSQHAPQAASAKILFAQTFIDRLSVKEGSRVLDLGCGNGDVTALLAEKVGSKGHVTGIDPNSARIEAAKQQNKNSNVSFFIGDAENFPASDVVPYNLVFSNYVPHFVENKRAMFENVFKNLQPGGQFAFVTILKTAQVGDELSLCMGSTVKSEIDKMYFMSPVEIYDKLATDCGFEVSLKETDNDVFMFPSLTAVCKFWVMCTAGKFNTENANQEALGKLKQKYGETKPVEWSVQVARYILTKK